MKTTRRWRNYKPREDPDEELHHFRRLDSDAFRPALTRTPCVREQLDHAYASSWIKKMHRCSALVVERAAGRDASRQKPRPFITTDRFLNGLRSHRSAVVPRLG